MRRNVELVWAGLLSFVLAETFAGSSPLWVTHPFIFLVTIPVYVTHFLLLAHLAHWSGRTSLPALYLFGVIFGLYETFITKVVWHGYPGASSFALGGFGPWFGIHETVGLVLFYHPVVSLLLPLAIATRLLPSFSSRFEQADWLFGFNPRARAVRVFLVFLFALMSGGNLGNPLVFVGTWLPSLAVLAVGYGLSRSAPERQQNSKELGNRPLLGRTGLMLVCSTLGALYWWSYHNLLPQFLPPAGPQLAILPVYAVLLLLIARTPPQSEVALDPQASLPDLKPLLNALGAIFVGGLAISSFSGQAAGPVTLLIMLAFASMVPIGAGLFAYLGLWRVLMARAAYMQPRAP